MSSPPSSSPAVPDPRPSQERRSAARRVWDHEIALRTLLGDTVRWASVQNISRTGIGLLLNGPLERGAALTLELGDDRRHNRQAVLGHVVHRRLEPQGHAYLGCAFEEALPEDWLETLLS